MNFATELRRILTENPQSYKKNSNNFLHMSQSPLQEWPPTPDFWEQLIRLKPG
jgi:hypothetical protein